MADVVISVHDVSKCYRVYESQRARLLHALWPSGHQGMGEVWALRNIDFEVCRGESVAIIGRNGSGKSTLLEIISGTLTPTSGQVQVKGRVAALLELGSGFNPEYTGRENVFLNGLLLGLSRAEVESRFDEIAGFADIGDVLDRPVKTYSSGMLVRLAFAVQVALAPEILIVDEALSVGDYFFQQKCFGRLRQMRENGMTLLFVSHDMNSVNNLCEKAIYLQKGQLRFCGDKRTAIRQYLSEDTSEKTKNRLFEGAAASGPGGLGVLSIPEAVTWRRSDGNIPENGGILAIAIVDGAGQLASSVNLGETVTLRVYFTPDPRKSSHVYFNLRNRFDQIVFTSGTYYLNLDVQELLYGQIALAEFSLIANLAGGGYSVCVTQGHPEEPNRVGEVVDLVENVGPLNIHFDYQKERAPFLGPFGVPVEGRVVSIY